MPEFRKGMEDENPSGEMLPNYSKIPVVNIVHSSYGIPDEQRLAATQYVESLIAQGVGPKWIQEHIDSEQKYARKDGISQSQAMLRALENVRHNLKAAEEAAKEPRDERGFKK